MKAVGDSLVVTQVDNWDFATMRHIGGQGTLYIRTKKKINTTDVLWED